MEIFRKLLLGACLLTTIQFVYVHAGGTKNEDVELGEHEFEVIINDEQFMHYFVKKGLNTNKSVSKMRKKIRNIFECEAPYESRVSDFPSDKSDLEAILYGEDFGISEFFGDERTALQNQALFNQQLNDATVVPIHEFRSKPTKIDIYNLNFKLNPYEDARLKQFKSVLKYAVLYKKIGEAVCSYLDKNVENVLAIELPHFYVKMNTKEKTFTIQAAPNHDQSQFVKTYEAALNEKYSCLIACLLWPCSSV